jgi:hypothetical protein
VTRQALRPGCSATFMYPGAIAPASPIILSFGHAATGADLPRAAVILYSQRGRVPAQIEPQPARQHRFHRPAIPRR